MIAAGSYQTLVVQLEAGSQIQKCIWSRMSGIVNMGKIVVKYVDIWLHEYEYTSSPQVYTLYHETIKTKLTPGSGKQDWHSIHCDLIDTTKETSQVGWLLWFLYH